MMSFKVQGGSLLSRAFVTGCAALLLSALPADAQNVVKGTVKDASGEALPGVSITLKGRAGTGTVTDANGNFSIDASRDACIGSADGYFVFDMVHVRQYNYWDALKQGIDNYLKTLKK